MAELAIPPKCPAFYLLIAGAPPALVDEGPELLRAVRARPSKVMGDEGHALLQAIQAAQLKAVQAAQDRGKLLAPDLLPGENFPRAGTAEWGHMNRLRAELIRKKIRGELSSAERVQLDFLQRRSLEELEHSFPRGGNKREAETPEAPGGAREG
jgi:hypothetical protein